MSFKFCKRPDSCRVLGFERSDEFDCVSSAYDIKCTCDETHGFELNDVLTALCEEVLRLKEGASKPVEKMTPEFEGPIETLDGYETMNVKKGSFEWALAKLKEGYKLKKLNDSGFFDYDGEHIDFEYCYYDKSCAMIRYIYKFKASQGVLEGEDFVRRIDGS